MDEMAVGRSNPEPEGRNPFRFGAAPQAGPGGGDGPGPSAGPVLGRAAVRDMQAQLGLPADGWPTQDLLNRL